MHPTAANGNYIRFLFIPLMVLLAFAPTHTGAAEAKHSYEDYQKTILIKPTCDPIKGSNTEGCFYQAPKAKNLATHTCPYPTQCVCYAKQTVGVYGTWGDGGRNLDNNSGPVVGAVIIFLNTHVGVILAFDGYNIGYTDRNSDNQGTIRKMVWTNIDDPTIWKYHKF